MISVASSFSSPEPTKQYGKNTALILMLGSGRLVQNLQFRLYKTFQFFKVRNEAYDIILPGFF